MTTTVAGRPTIAQRVVGRVRNLSLFGVFAGLVTAGIVILVGYPLISTLVSVFISDGRLDLSAFVEVWALPNIGTVLLNTFVVLAISIPMSLAIATLFAWVMERTDARIGWASTVLPLIPLMIPSLAGTVGWIALTSGRAGLLNVWIRDFLGIFGIQMAEGPFEIYSWGGLIFLYVLYIVPFGYLSISSALRNLDPSLEEAARVNGSGVFRTFWTVTLPSIKPALVGAFNIQLIIGFAMFSIPATVGVSAEIELLSLRIYRLLTFAYPPDTDVAVVLSILMLLVVALVGWWQIRVNRTKRFGTIGGRIGRGSAVELGRWRGVARFGVLFYIAATSILPFLGLIFLSVQGFWSSSFDVSKYSLKNYAAMFQDPEIQRSLMNSVMFGIQGGLIVMVVATIVAMYLARNSGFLAKVVDNVSRLPATIPHLVVAVAFVAAFAGPPFMLSGTSFILIAAYIVMYLPQAVVSANSAVAQVGNDIVEASYVSGAGQGRTFFRVMLPLIWPGFISGFALCFVLMAGELTGSAILAGINTPVIGFTMIKMWLNGSTTQLAALSVIVSVVFTVVTLLALLIGRRRQRHA
ncbi:ABC transporter permease [Microbacterium sp. CPCC 204701]|uniref:ABC transporter permease n=1 Tax=Microbacterium sp. CPCC 204701 TaxID=2493084 RepID=UPI000FDAE98B|nr:iron ABC transporter permease [Microbacterium sp. CPCC 204701]